VRVLRVSHDRYSLDIELDDPTREQRNAVDAYADNQAVAWGVRLSHGDDGEYYPIYVYPLPDDCRDEDDPSTADCLAILDEMYDARTR